MRAPRHATRCEARYLSRVPERSVTASDGSRYPLTNRFFFLYLLLVWRRRLPNARDKTFVWRDLIRRFPDGRRVARRPSATKSAAMPVAWNATDGT